MIIFGASVALVLLFLLIGRIAGVAVLSVQVLSHKIGVPVTFLGVLLGLFTSLPELGIGISAIILNGTPDVSIGNLLGGALVVLGLVLGLSLVVRGKVKTDGEFRHIVLICFVTLLPFLLLLLGGEIGVAGGVLMIGLYLLVLIKLYRLDGVLYKHPKMVEKEITAPVGRLFLAIALVLVVADLIMRLTLFLLGSFPISPFLLGLIVFPLATNIPELVIALVSWKKRMRDLSLANLMGSAMANTPIMGTMALFSNLTAMIDRSFVALIFFNCVLLVYLVYAYLSGKSFSRKEGCILLIFYIIYIFSIVISY